MYLYTRGNVKLFIWNKRTSKAFYLLFYTAKRKLLNKIENKVASCTIVNTKRFYFVRIDLKQKLLYTWEIFL
jgi:hypothetical protein